MHKLKCLLLNDCGRYTNFSKPEDLETFNKVTKIQRDLIEQFNPDTFEIDFVEQQGKTYDLVVVFNIAHKTTELLVRKGNVFALIQEPPYSFYKNIFYKNFNQYDLVFSPIKQKNNVVLSHPYLGWYYDTYNTHLNRLLPEKTKLLSCVMSNKKYFSGHRKRLRFLKKIKKTITIDHFGKGFSYITNKGDTLLPYYYSIAMENYSGDYYFSEKINDCFLAYTVPLYYGCTNIDKFFPPKSYIKIDINDTPGTTQIIKEHLNESDYNDRLPYVKEARELVLRKYHSGTFFKDEIIHRVQTNQNNPIVKHKLYDSKRLWIIYFIAFKLIKKIKKIFFRQNP